MSVDLLILVAPAVACDPRMLRGYALAEEPGAIVRRGAVYAVRSRTSDRSYLVSADSCECPDHVVGRGRRADHRCLHQFALEHAIRTGRVAEEAT